MLFQQTCKSGSFQMPTRERRAAFEAWMIENPGASDAYEKWSTCQPFRTDLATWHAFRAGAEWKAQTQPLGFQTRRAIKAEDELRAAQNEISDLNMLLNAAYVDPSSAAARSPIAEMSITKMKHNTKFKLRAGIAIAILLAVACASIYVAEIIYVLGRMS